MHQDVAELAREGRLVEAAERALAHGDPRAARELFEQACAWDRAAEASLAAGDPGAALWLAALGGAESVATAALEEVAQTRTKDQLAALGKDLRQRGQYAWAARTFERADANQDAAEAWERAGEPLRAATLLEPLGPVHALRALEAALRRNPDRDDVRVALGGLLLRCGKPERALRAVQKVETDSPLRREALEVARSALVELAMNDARAEVDAELATLVGPMHAAPPAREPVRPVSTVARLYGRYEIVREVSSTATARVLECEDTLRGERVALKVFSADGQRARGAGRDALARFLREARVLAELAHPNIVPLRDVIDQGPALVLAWMPGGTLEERLASEPFTPAHAVLIARSVLEALGEAHRIGVVHRDLKPANILFDAAGTPRLADFGVAHLGDLSVTATAGVFGSLAYMSPEQREGRPATAQSDLFGVGVILLEMLTGTRPVAQDGDTAAGVGDSLSAWHRHMGAEHDALARAMVARDPEARPASAFAASRALGVLSWPTDVDPLRKMSPVAKAASVHPPAERLVTTSEGAGRDAWLERAVTLVPLTDRSLARAIAFAGVNHRALQPMLRVDRDRGALWLGAPQGRRLARALLPDEREALAHALAQLHANGFVHGSVDRNALVVGTDGPVLLFPREEHEGSPEADLAALDAL
jgi:serine/threonine-protein kinase